MQIGYAIVTWLVAALVIEYPDYDLIESGIKLKTGLIDHYIFFLVFLFGVQTAEDGMKVIKWLLLGALFANVITILDAAGIINLGFRERVDGRTAGRHRRIQPVRGVHHPVPARRLIAAAVAAHGLRRLFWFGAALIVLHDAGHDGIARRFRRPGHDACAVGAYLYRHLISYSRVAGWVFGSLILLVLVVCVLAVRRTCSPNA